ncbi:MAG: AAA family ATPase [Gemmatimonadota bacterium]|nr:AAA family ATPase [Gemmatimonadota bacterium]
MSSASTSIAQGSPLRLRTFGSTALERRIDDGNWETVLRTGKPLALLVYLASADGRTVPREQLADLFWGDESPERARGSLRQALHIIRRAVGESILVADRDTVALQSEGLEVDRSRALRAIRAADVAELLQVYAGPFCPHLDVGRAPEFERWLEAERGHLERVVVDAVTAGIGRQLADGALDRAVPGARQLVTAAPDAPGAVVLLADALAASGALSEARERLEATAVRWDSAGQPVPPLLQERLDRFRRASVARPVVEAGTLELLGRTLVGREAPLASLLREAERARGGTARRVALVAPAGMGKTRLLDEFDARMRLRGARVVRVRFLPGMRGVPFAAAADLIRALASLPGALGISGVSARALIGLVPELVVRYVAADAAALPPLAMSLLARRDALADLLGAVSEDRLVLVLVDDLQYADEMSRDLLASVPRSAGRLFELYASRSGVDSRLFGPDLDLLLAPLNAVDARLLLAEVGAVPEADWVTEMLDRLVRRVRGEPQTLLAALRALVDGGHLLLDEGRWVAPAPEGLGEAIDRADGVPQSIASLSDAERRLLRLLATWARPMEEADLIAVMGADAAVLAALSRMAALGLVQSRDATWVVAHDAIVEGIDAVAPPPGEVAPLAAIIEHWAGHPQLTAAVLEHLALLCGARDDLAAARRLVSRVAGRRRWRIVGLRGRTLARAVARAAGQPTWAGPLDDAVGFLARRSDRGLALLGAGTAFAAGLLLWLLAMLQPRLVVESEPMAEVVSGQALHVLALIVQPRVVVRNGFGRALEMDLPVAVSVPGALVRGDSAVRLRDGRYQFERLLVQLDSARPPPRPDQWRIDLRGPWYVRDASVRIRGSGSADQQNTFRAISLRVAGGALVGPMHVRARLGDSLRFDLTFEYSTVEATANHIVAGTPTWGDRRRSVIRLAGLPSPVQNAWRTVTFSVPPPPRVGMHHVAVLLAMEDEAANVLSGTNWGAGEPIWFDGNDVVDLPPRAFEGLRTRGSVTLPRYLRRFYQDRLPDLRLGEQVLTSPEPTVQADVRDWPFAGTAIRIDVEAR